MTDLPTHEVPDGVDPDDWALSVTGAVADPVTLTVDDLRGFPLAAHGEDFTCVEGWRADDLSWRGVRVRDVLSRASPSDDASHVLAHATDGDYACAFPLSTAAAAVLALDLDGDPVPVEHGGPARLVPTGDADCWESVKWVAELDVLDERPDARDTAKQTALSRASQSP